MCSAQQDLKFCALTVSKFQLKLAKIMTDERTPLIKTNIDQDEHG